ncbi:hypothetical protein ACTSKR_16100 [Chitinibacteraceae bacterium HSL-7]
MSIPPELQFVFADSELATGQMQGQVLTLSCAAACVIASGQEGYAQGVALRLSLSSPDVHIPDAGRILSGRVWVDGQWATRLPLPSRLTSSGRLELDLAHGCDWVADFTALELVFLGEANFSESLFC